MLSLTEYLVRVAQEPLSTRADVTEGHHPEETSESQDAPTGGTRQPVSANGFAIYNQNGIA